MALILVQIIKTPVLNVSPDLFISLRVLGVGGMLGEILKKGSSLYTRLMERNEHIPPELGFRTALNKSIFHSQKIGLTGALFSKLNFVS